MRFNFDLSEPDDHNNDSPQSTLSSPSLATPTEEIQWIPLQNYPLFTTADGGGYVHSHSPSSSKTPTNLFAWDGTSRLYFWDTQRRCLHRISVKLGEPEPGSILAASPSKVLQADTQLDFEIQNISINRNGSAVFLSGLEGLRIMYLYGRTVASKNTMICRTISIGSEIYFDRDNLIRTLRVSWHPYSDTHLGILSSDSVFRIFNLSSSLNRPEQEYYLQPLDRSSLHSASSMCPVDFSFGGNHLWDRFSVFLLFSDGSIYVLCPVVPFGSVYKLEALMEIYTDIKAFWVKSSSAKENNLNMALSWLEDTFPELVHRTGGGNLLAVKAQPYAFVDSSISLQGPLCHLTKNDSKIVDAKTEGSAVSFLYSLASKDSILVTAWSGGKLHINALADEIQPVWKFGSPPRFFVDSNDQILGVAMICESVSSDVTFLKNGQTIKETVWPGYPPPLIRLAIVDLALPIKSSYISMFVDPLMPERIYCLHDGGVDSIVLHFLPFTSVTNGKEGMGRTPSVHTVITNWQENSLSKPPLCGFLALADSFGVSWIVGLTFSRECIVLQMETWNLLLPLVFNEKEPTSPEIPGNTVNGNMISKELLDGPKLVILPPSSSNTRSTSADSIEGRSMLHKYFDLFHENYMEYAHKVYVELKHHAPHLKKIIDDQHSRVQKAEQKLLKVDEKQVKLDERLEQAVQRSSAIEERLLKLRNLPGTHKRPLSKAEHEFKAELDIFSGVEIDALRSSVQAVDARLKRLLRSPMGKSSNQERLGATTNMKDFIPEDEISQLQCTIAKLSLMNAENSKKVKIVESSIKNREIGFQ